MHLRLIDVWQVEEASQKAMESAFTLRSSRMERYQVSELIDYKTRMITDEDPLRGLLFY